MTPAPEMTTAPKTKKAHKPLKHFWHNNILNYVEFTLAGSFKNMDKDLAAIKKLVRAADPEVVFESPRYTFDCDLNKDTHKVRVTRIYGAGAAVLRKVYFEGV